MGFEGNSRVAFEEFSFYGNSAYNLGILPTNALPCSGRSSLHSDGLCEQMRSPLIVVPILIVVYFVSVFWWCSFDAKNREPLKFFGEQTMSRREELEFARKLRSSRRARALSRTKQTELDSGSRFERYRKGEMSHEDATQYVIDCLSESLNGRLRREALAFIQQLPLEHREKIWKSCSFEIVRFIMNDVYQLRKLVAKGEAPDPGLIRLLANVISGRGPDKSLDQDIAMQALTRLDEWHDYPEIQKATFLLLKNPQTPRWLKKTAMHALAKTSAGKSELIRRFKDSKRIPNPEGEYIRFAMENLSVDEVAKKVLTTAKFHGDVIRAQNLLATYKTSVASRLKYQKRNDAEEMRQNAIQSLLKRYPSALKEFLKVPETWSERKRELSLQDLTEKQQQSRLFKQLTIELNATNSSEYVGGRYRKYGRLNEIVWRSEIVLENLYHAAPLEKSKAVDFWYEFLIDCSTLPHSDLRLRASRRLLKLASRQEITQRYLDVVLRCSNSDTDDWSLHHDYLVKLCEGRPYVVADFLEDEIKTASGQVENIPILKKWIALRVIQSIGTPNELPTVEKFIHDESRAENQDVSIHALALEVVSRLKSR